jgi:hypothetical protein
MIFGWLGSSLRAPSGVDTLGATHHLVIISALLPQALFAASIETRTYLS